MIPKNTWDRVLGRIESKISRHSYKTWFKPTGFLDEDASSISISVPNAWFAEWLKANYSGLIQDALRHEDRPGLQVRFSPEERELPDLPLPCRTGDGGAPAKLNPKYTFETFIVSSCNQFAHAASIAVAKQPSKAYNPLYVYGGVGLGKTHLMQAVGNRIAANGDLEMTYVSSETFMNQLINAIRFERTFEFKERYRNVDVLLIDDIQFLAGKERTQEEFFYTFNALYDAQKQIIITSDVPPRDIPTLEERLRSRFEWGLIADIQPPDLETKVAILRKKAECEGTPVPDDVALFIATHCGSNIRELEGAHTKVVAYASMSGREPSIELARETLHEFLPTASPAATIDSIMKFVSNYYNLKVAELKSKNNSPQVAFPRQVAMYLCKLRTGCSLPEIGRRFGGKHHSTVIHAVKKIDNKRRNEKEFARLLDSFEQSV
ncbi:MAG TPA: chromosomal replication initiator protein DnaA [Candidatus Polarisedimenticolaceae bacterium]|nr:chromosomal replication initiator protein DnaA [Candidatus Polarisedimenticolaceae bacterium]